MRNYLRSEFRAIIEAHADLIVMLPAGDPEFEAELRQQRVQVENFNPREMPAGLRALHGVVADASNRRHGFRNIHIERRAELHLSPRGRAYHEVKKAAARVVQHQPFFGGAFALERNWATGNPWSATYRETLERLKPDVVFSTDPYCSRQLPVSLQADALGIPTVASVVSWDNLSYKGHMLAGYSHYLLWSEMMRVHLREHLPSLPDNAFSIVGTPQFDFHLRDDLKWTREAFFQRIGGDPSRKLVTYSAAPDRDFPDEPEIVAGLWKSIADGQVSGNPQLLVRLHPHDRKPDRFDFLIERCPGILISRPWIYETARFWWFTPDEDALALLSNTLRYTDVNVNLASSMTLDSAIFDKPVVNVAFAKSTTGGLADFIRRTPHSIHYQWVVDEGAVRIARSQEELASMVDSYLRNPALDRAERRRMVDRICGPVDGRAAERTSDVLLSRAAAAGR